MSRGASTDFSNLDSLIDVSVWRCKYMGTYMNVLPLPNLSCMVIELILQGFEDGIYAKSVVGDDPKAIALARSPWSLWVCRGTRTRIAVNYRLVDQRQRHTQQRRLQRGIIHVLKLCIGPACISCAHAKDLYLWSGDRPVASARASRAILASASCRPKARLSQWSRRQMGRCG